MTKLTNYISGDASTETAPGVVKSWGALDPGPYIAIVKGNKDSARMGRLQVVIPALGGTTLPEEKQLITCDYLSPYYGSKSEIHTNPNSNEYKATQHSYGFWAIPPDIDTKVLVIFAEGKLDQAFWIGCIQDPFTNHMIPGIASSETTIGLTGGPPGKDTGIDKMAVYGTKNVPAGELNRQAPNALKPNYESISKPIHPFADTLLSQGLSADDVRGNTSSSARRESPSQVVGISTPGRLNTSSSAKNVGATDSGAREVVDRLTGHTFTMDDGDVRGENQLTRLRSASGHQILLHDTEGVVYIANGSGNAWIEMNKEGRIDVYSGVGGINMRTQGDFNLHSDANINMHAAGSVRMSASENIIKSSKMLFNLGSEGVFTSATNGAIRDFANQGISSYTGGQQLHGAAGGTHLAGGQIHFNSIGASNTWGPHWLNTGAVGITEREEGDVDITKKGIAPLEAFSKQTKTTVHRFVTHEPMPRFKGFTSVANQIWSDNPNESKAAERLMHVPGSANFIEWRNRNSTNESIVLGQYQADLELYLKTKMANSTDSNKARKLAEDFARRYDTIYKITEKANSISKKFESIVTGSTIKDVKENLQSKLTDQVIQRLDGNATTLFKDTVFVNNMGELFKLGGVTQTVNDTINGITGNIQLKNVGSVLEDISQVTTVYKNVMAGNITGVQSITKIAQKFGIGSNSGKFLKSGAAGGASLGVIGKLASGDFKGAVTSIGSFANRVFSGKFW